MRTKNQGLSQQWNLDSLYAGGSSSGAFKEMLLELEGRIDDFPGDTAGAADADILTEWEEISTALHHADNFVGCLLAQDVHDSGAETLEGHLTDLKARFATKTNQFDRYLCALTPQRLEALIKTSGQRFPLEERMERSKEKLAEEQEHLVNDLSVDGYHGWSQLYNSVIGHEQIPFRGTSLSWGQAYNKLSDGDPAVRKEIFDNSNHVWKEHRHIYSQILNRIAGFRLKLYHHRGWHFLKEPLDENRISQETLEAMWRAIDLRKKPFTDSLHAKARKLGLSKLRWCDVDAPIVEPGIEERLISYDEAAAFIIEQFAALSPRMSAFAQKVFDKHWVEAEDRPGKRPGGFCVGLPLEKESRIFMTYSGTYESLFTLAHEIGHAYHNEIIFDLPELSRHFPMNLAETASTFAEMVVSEAAYSKEKDVQRKKHLLDMKNQRNIIFLCNIHARFLFETSFYEERKRSHVPPERLCYLMQQAQQLAYDDALEEYHPYFWASKMHFNLTEVPFYNFPYTFGYLFSLGVYLEGIKRKDFDAWYAALLSDTGRMKAEDLAHKHLGADLKKEDYWLKCLDHLAGQII